MKILVVTQYFYPETFIINDICNELISQGHQVSVLTGKPNYPEGKIFPGYQSRGTSIDSFSESIRVFRIPLRPRGSGGAKALALNYLSFVWNASTKGAWLLRKTDFDVIFVFGTSPITVALPAILLKFIHRKKLALWVQDLWPESVAVTGFIKNRIVLKLIEFMVLAIYKNCDSLLVQSRAFEGPIKKISPTLKVHYFPNSFKDGREDVQTSLPAAIDDILDKNFSLVFAGNIGKAQSVETILNAALRLNDLPNFKIVFVGSGSMLAWIEEFKRVHDIKCIECIGRFDISYMPLIYSKAKAMLLTLNADEILKYTVPWKTQSYMAAGKPIIGAIDGEAARTILEARCGFCGEAENAQALAQNIRNIFAMSQGELDAMGQNGRKYFEDNFEMTDQVKKLTNHLSALADVNE